MLYPLVRELAADGIAVAVPCRVLELPRPPYYRWLTEAVTAADRVAAERANALFDAHRDDPDFGYRLLADEAEAAGQSMSRGRRGGSAPRTAGGRGSERNAAGT